jgi:hypothetical protein
MAVANLVYGDIVSAVVHKLTVNLPADVRDC